MNTATTDITNTGMGIPSDIEEYTATLDIAASSLKQETFKVRRFVEYCEGQGIDCGRDAVISFREALLEQGHKGNTVNAYLSAAMRFVKWDAIRNGGTEPKTVKGVRIVDDFQRDAVPTDIVRKMCKGEGCTRAEYNEEGKARDRAILHVLATTGCRVNEVSLMDVGDATEHTDGSATVLVQGKGHATKDAAVIIPKNAWAAVKGYLAMRGDASPTSPIFVSTSNNNRGQRMSAWAIGQMVKGELSKLGINSSRMTAHSIRHYVADALIRQGCDIVTVSRQLRHTSVAITQRYVTGMEKRKVAAMLDITEG